MNILKKKNIDYKIHEIPEVFEIEKHNINKNLFLIE